MLSASASEPEPRSNASVAIVMSALRIDFSPLVSPCGALSEASLGLTHGMPVPSPYAGHSAPDHTPARHPTSAGAGASSCLNDRVARQPETSP